MRRFESSIHCRSRAHCVTCRDSEGGRLWRAAMAEQFTVPGGAINFDCPDGLPWNVKENDVPDEIRPAEKKPCGCGNKAQLAEQLSTTRPSCLECVEKHLGAAWVLITEHQNGYPHRLLAIGHLHEAEEESQVWPALHIAIRHARKAYQQRGDPPDFGHICGLARGIASSANTASNPKEHSPSPPNNALGFPRG